MSLAPLLLLATLSTRPSQFASAFTSPSTSAPATLTHRQCEVTSSALFAEDSGGFDTAAEAATPAVDADDDGLTAQERVLRALGREPESDEDRVARIAARVTLEEEARTKTRTNMAVAVLAVAAAVFNYGWKVTHPVTAVGLLAEMQAASDPLTVVGRNGRPTVIDFWAPWCENCRFSAPTLRSIEKEYGGKVNFAMINADDPDSWPVIEKFGVDAIPHLAMISKEGDVETALIGPIPRSVLRADIDALLEGQERVQPKVLIGGETEEGGGDVEEGRGGERKPLPYIMYDAFRSRPAERRVQF